MFKLCVVRFVVCMNKRCCFILWKIYHTTHDVDQRKMWITYYVHEIIFQAILWTSSVKLAHIWQNCKIANNGFMQYVIWWGVAIAVYMLSWMAMVKTVLFRMCKSLEKRSEKKMVFDIIRAECNLWSLTSWFLCPKV